MGWFEIDWSEMDWSKAVWALVPIAFFAYLAFSLTAESRSKAEIAQAKRDVVVACYQSGKQDCDKLWKD